MVDARNYEQIRWGQLAALKVVDVYLLAPSLVHLLIKYEKAVDLEFIELRIYDRLF